MTTKCIFAVGSENPVKINCAAEAIKEFREFWPSAEAVGVHTESGVSNQPSSDHEMFIGALNRAQQALDKIHEARFGVGIEGGTLDSENGMWCHLKQSLASKSSIAWPSRSDFKGLAEIPRAWRTAKSVKVWPRVQFYTHSM